VTEERWSNPQNYVAIPHANKLFNDFSRNVIPYLEENYLDHGDTPFHRMGMPVNASWDPLHCSAYMREMYEEELGDMTATDPAIVSDIVRALGLDTHPATLRVLDSLLSSPQPTAPFLSAVESCTASNVPLSAMACTLTYSPELRNVTDSQSQFPPYTSSPTFANTTRVFLTAAIAMNTLSEIATTNPAYMYSTLNYLVASRWQPVLRNLSASSSPSSDDAENEENSINVAFLQAE
jgi:hypothetical protein